MSYFKLVKFAELFGVWLAFVLSVTASSADFREGSEETTLKKSELNNLSWLKCGHDLPCQWLATKFAPDEPEITEDLRANEGSSSSRSDVSSLENGVCFAPAHGECKDRLAGITVLAGTPINERSWERRLSKNVEKITRDECELDMIWFGDSITEFWEDKAGHVWEDMYEVSGSFRGVYSGISGDTSSQLLFRLQNGEFSYQYPKAIVIHIGTNDVMYATDFELANEDHVRNTAKAVRQRMESILAYIRQKACDTHIILVGVIAAGNSDTDVSWPSKFTDSVNAVNAEFQKLAAENRKVDFVDCQSLFLVKDGAKINIDLLRDTVHPSVKGYEVLARCVNHVLLPIVQTPFSPPPPEPPSPP
eukprot:CAMPEP_0177596024 /NCGR_PEP_ID=MMETSP0419_2-20121207/10749_1 /TAXON_ID=582737 /ORGANISM="Tetraselmis sp., Strain GSL018" /LENGTH=361 /DNA_ID=CAMNT_0019087683 /DNA_START=240 /DNA_END=1321 /DNA_ORIENTATION=-